MKRHRFDPLSFVFGALFLVLGVTFLVSEPGAQAAPPTQVWPIATLIVGASVAVWAISRAIKMRSPSDVAERRSAQPDMDTDATSLGTAASESTSSVARDDS